MSILIAYGSKTGTSRKCAELLADLLPDASVVDLRKVRDPNIDMYDAVIVGGSIRYGLLDRRAKNFVLRNVQTLRKKVTAYYICCGFISNAKQYFSTNFHKLALEHACSEECFGGDFPLDKMSSFDRFVLKAVMSNTDVKKEHKLPCIDIQAIQRLADSVKNALESR